MSHTLWAESFDHFGTTTALLTNGLWASIDSGWELSTTQQRTGTHSFRHTGGLYTGRRRARRTFGGARSQVGVTFGLYFPSLPSAANTHFAFSTIGDVPIITGVYQTDGSILFYAGGNLGTFNPGDATLLGTADAVIQVGTWNHVEVVITVSTTIGSVQMKVNGVTEFEVSDLNLGSDGAASIRWGSVHGTVGSGTATSAEHFLDDITAHDGAGFLGQARCRTDFVDADATPIEWAVTGAATAAEAVDETPPDDDASYISAANAGDRAAFTLPALPADVEDIIAIYVPARMRQEDAGITEVEIKLLSGAGEESGGVAQLTTSYSYHGYIFEADPALSPEGGWTKTSFENAILQIERVT